VICPRCGEQGYLEKYTVAGRSYIRVVHGRGKSRKRCYVGPAEGYEHDEPHLSLGLTNKLDIRYDAVAVSALEHFLSEAQLKGEEALERVRRLRAFLEEKLVELHKLEAELQQQHSES
jgi:hypothetical protein